VLRVNAIHEHGKSIHVDGKFTRAIAKAVEAEPEDLSSWLALERIEPPQRDYDRRADRDLEAGGEPRCGREPDRAPDANVERGRALRGPAEPHSVVGPHPSPRTT
jgi:hypothetical protein